MPVDPKQQPVPAEPTVMVKKADGTFVHMSLSKMGLKPTATPVSEPAPQVRVALPAKQESHALAVAAPVPQIFVDEAQYKIHSQQPPATPKVEASKKIKSWQPEDAAALLEEPLDHLTPHSPVSHELDERFQRIIRKMPFPLPTSLQERTQSLVLSRLKDIRTDEQILEYAQQSIAKGGLGLSALNAQALMKIVRDSMTPPTPVQPFILSPTIEEEVKLMAKTALTRVQRQNVSQIQNPPESVGKPVIHDVTPGVQREKRTIGPVEELHQFSQIDFEQLAPTPEMAVMKLVEKFLSLKQESFLLFLEAKRAWQESPLYQEYQQHIVGALQSGKSLEAYLAEQKKGMSFAEIQGIVSLNRQVL